MIPIVNPNLDYFYQLEASQFAFFRIPKALFTDCRFTPLSVEAKLLYGLMLDRMGLSLKNNWIDARGRVYIYFTQEEAAEIMGFSLGKVIKLFSELDTGKGTGLIERVKQGQGRPALIYLKNFASGFTPNAPPTEKEKPDIQNLHVKKSKSCKSRQSKKECLDMQDLNANDTEYNKTDGNNLSINEGGEANKSPPPFSMPKSYSIDGLRKQVKANIEYGVLCRKSGIDIAVLNEIVELIASSSYGNGVIRIGERTYPTQYVRDRFLSLRYDHIAYVLDCFMQCTGKIYNIKAYLLTSLFNAPVTINSYYTAEVQHDIY